LFNFDWRWPCDFEGSGAQRTLIGRKAAQDTETGGEQNPQPI
jgi:hypothetical protein